MLWYVGIFDFLLIFYYYYFLEKKKKKGLNGVKSVFRMYIYIHDNLFYIFYYYIVYIYIYFKYSQCKIFLPVLFKAIVRRGTERALGEKVEVQTINNILDNISIIIIVIGDKAGKKKMSLTLDFNSTTYICIIHEILRLSQTEIDFGSYQC